jgi:hypothetical protein
MAVCSSNVGSFFKTIYATTTRDIVFIPGEDDFFPPSRSFLITNIFPVYPDKRDDSGLPDWLKQDNATYFSQLYRTVDDVSPSMGVLVPDEHAGRGRSRY